ncbi:helix-turn-helix domain-containing protein [Fictibacillus gelatini]|uniref:helix-turn-helix domain-containing protein n=1 Tax=Fictibacillus gelatini TaxID=225985 RepID=UPI00041E59B3|nr:helix-turn-helix transcriptional regulator [Fictibacillus gelatini]
MVMVIVHCRLKELLEERKMEQKELASLTKIREATISEMCRNINKTFPRHIVEKIADALELNDINELITFEHK